MKELKDISRNTKIKVFGEWYKFYHLDGMYSYCEDSKGNVRHWKFNTPIEKVGKRFKN